MGARLVSDPQNPSEAARLKALEARIAAAKAAGAPTPHVKKDYSQAQVAWRMVIELVAGLVIGFGIGYGLDTLLGTMPIFLVLFIGFGLAAGVKTMLRSANEVQERRQAEDAAEKRDD
ncbi:AtpZ/AtpI family protein [Rhodobacter sp. ETT8]|uniref:ATP synthase protein I n=1 Tax=Pseudotabrizicola algicola TaxID=2709381 RepID=A0A6B3RX62_9RHOB|nr:AtpZ/AtpI family protein [Pseudotabrizicola algicola]NEX47669.1 AtpZ/AtpI family protein [Pseudotabrizicola algicola]